MTDQNDDKTRTHVVLTKGTIVSHYRIIEKIGAGGMGEVYLAEDSKLKRKVALKFMPAELASDADFRSRFRREAQAAAKLDHPNITPVYEVGEFHNRPFIAMAHIKGRTLREIIKEGKLTTSDAVEFVTQICAGLHQAHEAGIVHRDIKPGNIIIDSANRVRLLDFGLATVSGEEKLTKAGSTLGTVGYMSPEQVLSRPIDRRADLFSVGVILYEMVTGRLPFSGENDASIVKAIVDSVPEPIARFKSGVTGELQQIISKALAKEPSLRHQHADDMIADLKRLGLESVRPDQSRRIWWGAAVLVLIVSGYFISGLFQPAVVNEPDSPPVLIVLPFENLGATDDDYFADGIRYEINSRLTSIKEMRVISQRSADKYKKTDSSVHKSAQQIGLEIGADYILEATIRWDKTGEVDLVRIIPRLTKTSDNYLMWAENYEERLVEIFSVQSKIADQIVLSLGLTLIETGKLAPEGTPTTNMEAYNFYLRGLEISSHTFNMSDFNESIEMYDSAIALDSNFALAWAQKSINHSTFNFFFTSVEAGYHKEEALKAAERSLELGPGLPTAKIALGTYYNYIERDYSKALESFYSAKSEITSNAELSQSIGIVYMRQGKWQEALSKLEEAVRIDPLNVRRYFYITNCLTMTRDYELAYMYLDRALVLEPSNADAAYMMVFLNLLKHGTLEYGDQLFGKITDDAGLSEVSTYELASASALGLWRFIADSIEPTEAIEDVRKLGKVRNVINERSPHITQMNIGQIYDLTGHHDSAMIHYDSSRILINNIIDLGDYQYHALSELGLTLAMMGRKEEAIQAGKAGKELMPVDECHW